MLELFSLKQKVAIITGASRGLGRTMAKGLAAAGAQVVLVARDEAKLNETRDEIFAGGGQASVLALDLADEEAIRTGVRRIGSQLGRIDICVNNAGIINWQPILDSDVDDFERIMDTNVKAAFIMSQECATFMRSGGRGGRIVNIGSILSTLGRAKLHAYCAASQRSSALRAPLPPNLVGRTSLPT